MSAKMTSHIHPYDVVTLEGDWLAALTGKDFHDIAFATADFPGPEYDHYIISAEGRLLIKDGAKRHDLNYHGMLVFSTDPGCGGTAYAFEAKFTDGQLVKLEMLEIAAADDLSLSVGTMPIKRRKPPDGKPKAQRH